MEPGAYLNVGGIITELFRASEEISSGVVEAVESFVCNQLGFGGIGVDESNGDLSGVSGVVMNSAVVGKKGSTDEDRNGADGANWS